MPRFRLLRFSYLVGFFIGTWTILRILEFHTNYAGDQIDPKNGENNPMPSEPSQPIDAPPDASNFPGNSDALKKHEKVDDQRCKPKHIALDSTYVKKTYATSEIVKCWLNKQIIDVINGKIHYTDSTLNGTCKARGFRMITDSRIYFSAPPMVLTEGQGMPEPFLKVQCTEHTTGLAYPLRDEAKIAKKKSLINSTNLNLNIYLLGFDSTSHVGAMHMIPKTLDYIRSIGGVVLEGYNIVGDGTPQAMTPIFTGKNELELPSVRKDDRRKAKYIDEAYPLLHSELSKIGYVSTYFERMTTFPMYGMRFKGFKHAPADFYSLPYYRHTEKHFNEACFRDKQEYEYTTWFHRQMFHTYHDVPKFMFAWNTISHAKIGYLANADEHLLQHLMDLNSAVLNNTAVFLMGDHGPRFGETRKSYEGRLEERSPLMSMILPTWLTKSYPEAMQKLRRNVPRLTTPYDIHETLRHLVYGLPRTKRDVSAQRGISLFDRIPANRTCASAGVASHWCTCLRENVIDPLSDRSQLTASAVVDKINALTSHVRDRCVKLRLGKIEKVTELLPEAKLLQFSGALDKHGFEYGFNDNVSPSAFDIQVVFQTAPGGNIYEATVAVNDTHVTVDPAVISITSKYGDRPHCIKSDYPNLRKFCICPDYA